MEPVKTAYWSTCGRIPVPAQKHGMATGKSPCGHPQFGGSAMATLTAQILAGSPHPNHGGIDPTHSLFLSENSHPAWILVDSHSGNGPGDSRIVWIPTLENMLEDALLMIAVHVCKDDGILNHIKSSGTGIESGRVEMYSDTTESQRRQLYEKCREIPGFPKIVISIFKGSSIERQLPILENYTMDVEVCTPIYSRWYSHWQNETRTEGSLR